MENHHLVIEPYVHYNIKSNKAILFNTLDNSYIITEDPNALKLLRNLKNGICKFRLTRELEDFVQDIRNKFIGDILPINDGAPTPLTIPEYLNINDFNKIKINKDIPDLKDYIFEVNIYLNNSCDLTCDFCDRGYKQFTCCTKSNNVSEINISIIEGIISELSPATKLVLSGGNILKYKELYKVILEVKDTYKLNNITVVLHINNIETGEFDNIISFLNLGISVLIIVDYNSLSKLKSDYTFIQQQIEKSDLFNLKFNFVMEDEYALTEFSKTIDKLAISKYIFTPYYNGKNLEFFKQFVFVNEEDILSNKQGIKLIKMKKIINTNFFGKLFVLPSGELYENFYTAPLGNLNVNKSVLFHVERLLRSRKEWFNIRKGNPCNSCIFQWLCPPVSNYEHEINKLNLCNINN